MQLDRLLDDATQMPPGTSQRQKHIRLAELLNERHGNDAITTKGVAKWFERGSIPSLWLMRVASLPKVKNLNSYAEPKA